MKFLVLAPAGPPEPVVRAVERIRPSCAPALFSPAPRRTGWDRCEAIPDAGELLRRAEAADGLLWIGSPATPAPVPCGMEQIGRPTAAWILADPDGKPPPSWAFCLPWLFDEVWIPPAWVPLFQERGSPAQPIPETALPEPPAPGRRIRHPSLAWRRNLAEAILRGHADFGQPFRALYALLRSLRGPVEWELIRWLSLEMRALKQRLRRRRPSR